MRHVQTRVARRRGMTLIELMVALGLTVIASAAAYSLFVAQSKSMRSTQAVVEIQDNARVAMDLLVRDLRNAGFLVPATIAVGIEDNCGSTANDVTYDSASGNFAVGGGGTAVITDGDFVGTTQKEGCPNGSDRLTVVSRPRIDFAEGIGGPGHSLLLTLKCPNNDCKKMLENGGIEGTSCEMSACSEPVVICRKDDPFTCHEVEVQPNSGGGNGCQDCTAPDCTVKVYDASGSTPCSAPFQSDNDWDDYGGKDGVAFQAINYRVYQILDLDGDGATELAFSDDAYLKMRGGTVEDATWTVVAYHVDDFQVAWSSRAAPMAFASKSLLIYPGCDETQTSYDCGTEYDNEQGEDPIAALRVSILARSASKERTPQGGYAAWTRNTIENNTPGAYTETEASAPGGFAYCYASENCGCGTPKRFANCTGNGNAPGFRRRVLTQTVSLRNVQGFSF